MFQQYCFKILTFSSVIYEKYYIFEHHLICAQLSPNSSYIVFHCHLISCKREHTANFFSSLMTTICLRNALYHTIKHQSLAMIIQE